MLIWESNPSFDDGRFLPIRRMSNSKVIAVTLVKLL